MPISFGDARNVLQQRGIIFNTFCSQVATCFTLLILVHLHQGKETDLMLKDSSSLISIENSPQCHNFTFGDPDKKEFYSPRYPENYLRELDCFKRLEAEPGFLIKLDFRDKFYIEPSENCQYDYLEIRNGAHGYSQVLGKYCGQQFPPITFSSDRFLWLRFHTDSNLEYSGFKAVYQFFPRPTSQIPDPPSEMCVKNINGIEGIISNKDIEQERIEYSRKHPFPLDCMWVIKLESDYKIQLSFPKFELQKINECGVNVIEVFYDKTDAEHRQAMYCGSRADPKTSDNNIVNIRFYAEKDGVNSTFEILFTALRNKGKANCLPSEYDCQDGYCIDGSLKCNGRKNCRFQWDEDKCQIQQSKFPDITSEHIIIIMVIGCLIIFGMCFAMVFNCVKKLIQDHRTMQEHARQSREGRLDDVAKNISRESSPHPSRHSYMPEPPDDPGCYVPGGELPVILNKRSNGDAVFLKENEMGVEMRDNECQTRDSLLQNRDSDRSCTPPPPPPPAAVRFSKGPTNFGKPASAFSTFRGRGDKGRELAAVLNQPLDPPHKFRAEAVIEMQQKQQQQQQQAGRPYSIESTKSAPDVIVTH